jgi:flagellin
MAQTDFTRIATNIGALNSLQSLRTINNKLGIHQQRLSTGKRINSAADDPAGLTIATKMLARSEGLKVSLDNIGDAKNMLSVAEAGLGKITDILVSMRSNAERAASDTLGSTERAAIASQLQSYAEQIDNIVAETKWNGVQLLDGTVNKRFQTGADEGEFTNWTLSQEHTAGALNVSEAYTSDGFANEIASASMTDVGTTGVFTGLTQLATGSYSFEILGKAADATNGYVEMDGGFLGNVDDVTVTTIAGANEELASGTYTMAITDVDDATHVSYTITDANGTVVESVTDGDISSGVVVGNGGNEVGITLDYATTAADLNAGDTMTFEYINAGQVKLGLNDGSGQAVLIDENGATGGDTAAATYADAGTTVNTGRGVNVDVAAIGTAVVGQKYAFDYHQGGEHVVDVSTAVKAGAYMTTVTNALDIVNSSMSDLGSLMARLTYKEEAVSVAQVNVEASYNRIMNADMAYEQLESTKLSILQQTAITMLAQANTAPQNILTLFR